MGILNDLYQLDRQAFATVMERLHDEQYTGPVTFEFSQGTPGKVVIPGVPRTIMLDNRAKRVRN